MEKTRKRGRPARRESDPLVQLTVRLRRSCNKHVREVAEAFGVTPTFVLRRSIEMLYNERGVDAFRAAVKIAA